MLKSSSGTGGIVIGEPEERPQPVKRFPFARMMAAAAASGAFLGNRPPRAFTPPAANQYRGGSKGRKRKPRRKGPRKNTARIHHRHRKNKNRRCDR